MSPLLKAAKNTKSKNPFSDVLLAAAVGGILAVMMILGLI